MSGYQCVCCGSWHDELPTCFLVPLPLYAFEVPEAERTARVQASSDQCVVDGEHFFMLGNLDLPLESSDRFIRWTVWTSLSEANFHRATELWETAGRESEPPYFGWLNNQIPGYESTLSLKTQVQTQPVGVRPLIKVMDDEHPLALDQRFGVGLQRFDELIHAAVGAFPPPAAETGKRSERPWWKVW